MIEAIEAGFFQREIADASYRYQRSLETKDRVIVGVNAFEREESQDDLNLLKIGRDDRTRSSARVQAVRGDARRRGGRSGAGGAQARLPLRTKTSCRP